MRFKPLPFAGVLLYCLYSPRLLSFNPVSVWSCFIILCRLSAFQEWMIHHFFTCCCLYSACFILGSLEDPKLNNKTLLSLGWVRCSGGRSCTASSSCRCQLLGESPADRQGSEALDLLRGCAAVPVRFEYGKTKNQSIFLSLNQSINQKNSKKLYYYNIHR